MRPETSSALSPAACILRLSCTQCKTAPLPLRKGGVLRPAVDLGLRVGGFTWSKDVVGEERVRAESPRKLGVQALSFPPASSTVRLI